MCAQLQVFNTFTLAIDGDYVQMKNAEIVEKSVEDCVQELRNLQQILPTNFGIFHLYIIAISCAF